MKRRGYPYQFRQRALALIEAGRRVAQLEDELSVSRETLYAWRRKPRIGRGEEPGLRSLERAELAVAKRRVHELEAELEVHRRATELLREGALPKPDSQSSK